MPDCTPGEGSVSTSLSDSSGCLASITERTAHFFPFKLAQALEAGELRPKIIQSKTTSGSLIGFKSRFNEASKVSIYGMRSRPETNISKNLDLVT